MINPPAVSLDVAARFASTIERRRLPLAALFIGTGASLVGRQLATIAAPWAIYSATGSLAQAGLTATCLIFPWLLTDPKGTAFAARIGHKPASVVAGILGATTVTAIPLFDLTERLPLATMLLVLVLFAALTALGSTSRHALMPEAANLAGQSIERVGGAIQTVARLAIVGGSLLAGVGITQLGQNAPLGIAASLIAIAAAADALLLPPTSPISTPGRHRHVISSTASTQRPARTLDQT